MADVREKFTETDQEVLFEMELDDLAHLVVAPEQDPFSERPMEYLGQSAVARMMHLYRPTAFQKRKRYRLVLRMPREKVSPDTASQ
ncbi:MAG TPA: hypothetical protein VLU38_02650, partial [Methanomassiliicoccales archaeon]|nr:hypothetical protein [Methanomassiliicoccales archaeon]